MKPYVGQLVWFLLLGRPCLGTVRELTSDGHPFRILFGGDKTIQLEQMDPWLPVFVPGPTNDAGPLRRQLERYAKG